MMKKFTTQFYRCVIPFILAFCLIFVDFTSPAYAASSNPFMDSLKEGAGQAVGAGFVAGAFCLGSAVLAPLQLLFSVLLLRRRLWVGWD